MITLKQITCNLYKLHGNEVLNPESWHAFTLLKKAEWKDASMCDSRLYHIKIYLMFILLFSLNLAELGDCDPAEHTLDLVSEFRFVPEQTEDMELAIYNHWKECRW